jgi:hypothetical protein
LDVSENPIHRYLTDDGLPAQEVARDRAQVAAANPSLNDNQITHQTLSNAVNAGDMDRASDLTQSYRHANDHLTRTAMAALDNGDVNGSMRLAKAAQDYIPDGNDLRLGRDANGNLIANVHDVDTGNQLSSHGMTLQQYRDYLEGHGSGFDHTADNGLTKNLQIASRNNNYALAPYSSQAQEAVRNPAMADVSADSGAMFRRNTEGDILAGAPGSMVGVPVGADEPLVQKEIALAGKQNPADLPAMAQDPHLLQFLPEGYFNTPEARAAANRLDRAGIDKGVSYRDYAKMLTDLAAPTAEGRATQRLSAQVPQETIRSPEGYSIPVTRSVAEGIVNPAVTARQAAPAAQRVDPNTQRMFDEDMAARQRRGDQPADIGFYSRRQLAQQAADRQALQQGPTPPPVTPNDPRGFLVGRGPGGTLERGESPWLAAGATREVPGLGDVVAGRAGLGDWWRGNTMQTPSAGDIRTLKPAEAGGRADITGTANRIQQALPAWAPPNSITNRLPDGRVLTQSPNGKVLGINGRQTMSDADVAAWNRADQVAAQRRAADTAAAQPPLTPQGQQALAIQQERSRSAAGVEQERTQRALQVQALKQAADASPETAKIDPGYWPILHERMTNGTATQNEQTLYNTLTQRFLQQRQAAPGRQADAQPARAAPSGGGRIVTTPDGRQVRIVD